MRLFNFLILIVTFQLAFTLEARVKYNKININYESSNYEAGAKYCYSRIGNKNLIASFFIPVPIDYHHQERGVSQLFVWLNKPFDPLKKTLVFIDGGPGNTSHDMRFQVDDWNVIFFDQRGNSCSRPENESLFLDNKFYSSKNTANDIEMIRRFFNVNKISIYAVSYGTVPAQIYAHLYPKHLQSVVLEGTIFQGGELLISPKFKLSLLNSFFQSLDKKTQQRIVELSGHSNSFVEWFAAVGNFMMYLDDSFNKFEQFLNLMLWDNEGAFELISTFKYNLDFIEPDFGASEVVLGMLGCKELGMNLAGLSPLAYFEKNPSKNSQVWKLKQSRFNYQQQKYCKKLGFNSDSFEEVYSAIKYPSHVPTFYIQGEYDGATVLDQALKHFFYVSYNQKQLLIAKKGGHQPFLSTFTNEAYSSSKFKVKMLILKKFLNAEMISENNVSDLNKNSDLQYYLY